MGKKVICTILAAIFITLCGCNSTKKIETEKPNDGEITSSITPIIDSEVIDETLPPLGDCTPQPNIIIFNEAGGRPNDKTFDNSVILQEILDTCEDGTTIVLGQGIYEFTTPIIVEKTITDIKIVGLSVARGNNEGTAINWSGDGIFLSFLDNVDGLLISTMLVTCNNNSFLNFEVRIENSTIEDLFVINASKGIAIASYSNVIFNNIATITENGRSEYAILIDAISESNNLTIVKSSFDGQNVADGDSIVIQGGEQISIINSDICNWSNGTGIKVKQKDSSRDIDKLVLFGINVARCHIGIEISEMKSRREVYADNISLIFLGESNAEKGIRFVNNKEIQLTLLGLQCRMLGAISPEKIIECQDTSIGKDSNIEVSQNVTNGNIDIKNSGENLVIVDRSFSYYQRVRFDTNGIDTKYILTLDSNSSFIGSVGGNAKIVQGNKCTLQFMNTFGGQLILELVFEKAPAKGHLSVDIYVNKETIDYASVRKQIETTFSTVDKYGLYKHLLEKNVAGVYSIEHFGGKSEDRSVDNSQAFEKAIDYMQSHSGVIILKPETYYCNSSIVVDHRISSMQILGQRNRTNIEWQGSDFLLTVNQPIWWSRFDGFSVICNDSNFFQCNDIMFKSYLSNIEVENCRNAISIGGFAYSFIENISIDSLSANATSLIDIGYNYNVTREYIFISNCTISGSLLKISKAISILSGTHIFATNINFYDINQPVYLIRDKDAPMLSLIYFDKLTFNNCLGGLEVISENYIGQILMYHCNINSNAKESEDGVVTTKKMGNMTAVLNITNSFLNKKTDGELYKIEDGSLHMNSYIQKE